MISVLFLVAIVWLGLILDDEFSLSRGDGLVRLAAGIILGCLGGTWLVYVLSLVVGFHASTVAGATAVLLLTDALVWRARRRDRAWLRSLVAVDAAFWRVFGILAALVVTSFALGVWRNADGDILFRGNFIDMAYHMGTVSAFLEQTAFPPFNPQSATAKLSYHFMTDFFSAILCRGGFSLFCSLKIPIVLFGFSLGTLTCWLFHSVLRARSAAVCACVLFLFGHIGVFNLLYGLAGYPVGNAPLSLGSWSSIQDHLTYPYFNFLNILVDYFEPQLPFLFGFPLAALVLTALFRRFAEGARADKTTWFVLALVALLPLFHMHTFLVLAPLTGLAAIAEARRASAGRPDPRAGPASPRSFDPAPWIRLLLFSGLAAAAVAPQLLFIFSQRKVAGFSGFDVAERLGSLPEIPTVFPGQRFWYWIRAAGAPFILGLAGFIAALGSRWRRRRPLGRADLALLALFGLGAAAFVAINFYRMSPAWGDSNKLFLYWNLALCIYAGRLLSRFWRRSRWGRAATAAVLILGAILPTAVEWGVRYGREPITLFTAADQFVADWIRLNTPRDAVFLTANTLAHYVPALAGRRVVNGAYTRETGFADGTTEEAVARAFRDANPGWIGWVRVTHVVVGPEEKGLLRVSRAAMARWHRVVFDATCRGARYSVYEVRPVSAEDLERERAAEKTEGFEWLSRLDPTYVKQFGSLKYDEGFDADVLKTGGKVYPKGLGTHAPSEIRFDLGGQYATFESDIGVDDSQMGGPSSVVFQVKVDNRLAFTSPVLNAGSPPQQVKVDVTGAKTLTLIVGDAGDGNHCDHADWAGARLVRKR